MVEGAELIRTALAAGAPVASLYVAPSWSDDRPTRLVCDQAAGTGARVFPLAPGVMERVADTVTPQPVLAVLPMLPMLREPVSPVPAALEARPGSLIVVMVDVRDPGNAGTVLRAADASGCRAVFFAADSVDPYNPKTVRSSAGSLFHLPFGVRADTAGLAAELGAAGYRTLATVVRDGDDYARLDWSVPTALFLGNESWGLERTLSDELSGTLAIPMAGRAESLNVGVACAVLCFEALRQRRAGSLGPRSISESPTQAPPPRDDAW